MSEDLLDQRQWCHICDAQHPPCATPDMRYECMNCDRPVQVGEEWLDRYDGIVHQKCGGVRPMEDQ